MPLIQYFPVRQLRSAAQCYADGTRPSYNPRRPRLPYCGPKFGALIYADKIRTFDFSQGSVGDIEDYAQVIGMATSNDGVNYSGSYANISDDGSTVGGYDINETAGIPLEQFADRVRAKHASATEKQTRIDNDPLYALELAARSFDRYYSYSDDHRVWSAGQAAKERIEVLAAKCRAQGLDPSHALAVAYGDEA